MMRRLTLVFLMLSVLLPNRASSSEWSLKGFVDQDLSYDDNVCMQPDGQLVDRQCQQGVQQNQRGTLKSRRGSFKYMIVPVITFQHKTDVSDVAASASYGTQLYTEMEGFDQDFQNYNLTSLYKTTRFDWELAASYSATPTRNNAVQSGAGFGSNASQNTWSVSPSVTYKIDEIDSISFTPTYSETTFTDGGNGNAVGNLGFNDSRSFNLDLAWQRLWSERYKTALIFSYNNFESDGLFRLNQGSGGLSTFDSFGINIGNTYLISDNWQLDGTIGGRYTESKNPNIQGIIVNQSSFGFLADIGIAYTGESYTSRLHFNRALTPSSFGQLQEQTGIDLNFSYKILETLSASLTTAYQESSIVNSDSAANNGGLNNSGTRKNFVIEPSVTWQLARDWTLGGSYRYRFQDGQNFGINNITGEADSNLFMLSINYNWQGIKVSR